MFFTTPGKRFLQHLPKTFSFHSTTRHTTFSASVLLKMPAINVLLFDQKCKFVCEKSRFSKPTARTTAVMERTISAVSWTLAIVKWTKPTSKRIGGSGHLSSKVRVRMTKIQNLLPPFPCASGCPRRRYKAVCKQARYDSYNRYSKPLLTAVTL